MTNEQIKKLKLIAKENTIEERLTRIEDKVDLLITQLKIEFYKK